MKNILKNILGLKKEEKKTMYEKQTDKKIEDDLLKQLYKFREDTKDMDYLRKQMEEVNKGKSDVEILESLAKAFKDDKNIKSGDR